MMHQLRPSVNKLSGLIGTLIHTPVFGEISVIQRGAVLYNSEGVITNILDQRDEEDLSSVLSKRADIESFVDYGDAMVLPGLIDAHCHAPQYVFTGTGMDLPLLEWLEKYTFPCESKFADLDFARLAYTKAVRRHLSLGTTFCSYFGTLHADAADVLVQVAEEAGQRAFVGKVSMDRNSPPYYVEATADGIRDAEAFVVRTLARSAAGRALLQHVNGNAEEAESSSSAKRRKTDGADADPDAGTSGGDDEYTIAGTPGLLNTLSAPLVLPCVTPRFVPTCSPEMLQALGALSRKYRLPLQSHLSESTSEIEWVRALHPECTSYGEVYHHYGLLHEAAYMAHCVHSGSDERRLLARSRTGAVHCASSNFNLCSGVMNARQFIRDGIKLGLGTDVAGGHSASMLDAIRQTIVASTAKTFELRAERDTQATDTKTDAANTDFADEGPLSYKEALYLATMGSARVLNMDRVVGSLEAGKKLDVIVVSVTDNVIVKGAGSGSSGSGGQVSTASSGGIDCFNGEDALQRLQKWLFLGDDRNLVSAFVDGRQVL